jgi:hypothetical protein
MIIIPMNASAWRIQWSSGLPNRALPDGSGWKFNFPPNGYVGYVNVHILKDISAAKQITIVGSIEGGPFIPTGDQPPATFSLFFQRQGDDGTEAMQDYRWWAPKNVLVAGNFSISASLEPAVWGNVMGRKGDTRLDAFKAAMRHCANIGFTCGGNSFSGHGVRGTGVFRCQSYTVD